VELSAEGVDSRPGVDQRFLVRLEDVIEGGTCRLITILVVVAIVAFVAYIARRR
jgi:hypothetical protein